MRAEPNPYSPFADADPKLRHIFPVPIFFPGPRPGVLQPTGCERMAVVPQVPVEVPAELPDGLCPLCVAAELEAGRAVEDESDALAESLATTVRDLQAYIEVRADEIAGPLITATQQRAEEELGAVRAAATRERQRNGDLIAELRRQLDALVRTTERQHAELKELRELRKRVVQNLVTCATGPDGVRYAPYSALAAAVWPEKKTEDPT